MNAELRSLCGLGYPLKPYTQNANECINNVIKQDIIYIYINQISGEGKACQLTFLLGYNPFEILASCVCQKHVLKFEIGNDFIDQLPSKGHESQVNPILSLSYNKK